jgi:hypothetical protein
MIGRVCTIQPRAHLANVGCEARAKRQRGSDKPRANERYRTSFWHHMSAETTRPLQTETNYEKQGRTCLCAAL